MNDRAPLGRLALGATVLAGERLRLVSKPVPETLALLVGLAERGAARVRGVLLRAGDTAKQIAPRPPKRVREFLNETRARGDKTIRIGRLEAKGWLNRTVDDSIRWAERNAISRVVDDLTPHIVNNVLPNVLDGVLPHIRTRVVPFIIEDLSTGHSSRPGRLRSTRPIRRRRPVHANATASGPAQSGTAAGTRRRAR
jgi:hypothetical protein